jgi:hypothetical protein
MQHYLPPLALLGGGRFRVAADPRHRSVEHGVVFWAVRRLLVRAALVYVLFAVIGRFVEGMGAVQCGCAADCWCRQPVLSTFRWVFPYGHRGADPCGKAAASQA